MPNTRLSDIEEVPGYEAVPTSEPPNASHRNPSPAPGLSNSTSQLTGSARELESDYYLGGYDIDSDYPPPQDEDLFSGDQLPVPLPNTATEDYAETYPHISNNQSGSKENTLSSGFHPSQYLPPHQLPLGDGTPSQNEDLSIGASSASDVSNPCAMDSETNSERDSLEELRRGVTITTESQQQTEV